MASYILCVHHDSTQSSPNLVGYQNWPYPLQQVYAVCPLFVACLEIALGVSPSVLTTLLLFCFY